MATGEQDMGERSGRLVASQEANDSRVVSFYFIIGALLLILATGLGYQQLIRTGVYSESERLQTQRRILIPGPRGNIYDRNGRLLVGNKAHFAAVLYLDELQDEFRDEAIRVRNNYRAAGDKEVPTRDQFEQIARASVVQKYLDQVNAILGRSEQIEPAALARHFRQQLYMPYMLVDGLSSTEFSRLLEQLPVRSPLQLYV